MKQADIPAGVRLLTRAQARTYCGGVDPATIAAPVALQAHAGLAVPMRPRWDRKALDAALDRLAGLDTGRRAEPGSSGDEEDLDEGQRIVARMQARTAGRQ